MNQATRRSTRRSAFTIIEVIVIVVIIGILAAVIAPRLLNRVGQAKRTAAEANANAVATAVATYIADCGKPPAGASLESFLMSKPSDVGDNWKGPYLQNKDQLKDPWGQPFQIVMPGKKNADFDIVSYGEDKQPGGEGDNADIIKP
jgi:general secretion pathway protein G